MDRTLKLLISAYAVIAGMNAYCQDLQTVTVFKQGENGYDTYRIPAIVSTGDGGLIAFAEGRKNSRADDGDIDLVMKRSADNGKTWSSMSVIWDDSDNTCGNPSPVLDRETGDLILLACHHGGNDGYELTHGGYDARHVYVLRSSDKGITWSEPEDITKDVKFPNWKWYATGPCHAIQLRSGRLLVPCDHGLYPDKKEGSTESHIIYSDDHGRTWKVGGNAGVGNESSVTELSDGSVMLNMRGSRRNRSSVCWSRLVAVSKDGGESFGKPFFQQELIEPVCEGTITNYTRNGVPRKWLIFTNPSDTSKRQNLVLKMSRDDGKTWFDVCTVTAGPAAYSDNIVLPDGSVGILYETGKEKSYESIAFSVVPAKTINNADVKTPDKVLLLYPKGQNKNIGIKENGKKVTEGPGEANGLEGPEVINEYGNISNISDSARIELYMAAKPNGKMIVVCPGGGYSTVCSRKEGQDVAQWMNPRGISVCVVDYRLPNGHPSVPLTDVQNAFRYCRSHAEEWGVKTIGVMGFSAGGHLAAMASTIFTDDVTRPDFSILIYPVINLDHHKGTCESLVGTDAEAKAKYCLETRVTKETPKTFLALSQNDNVVDTRSSQLYYEALRANGVKREMYIFPTGAHGWGFLSEEPCGRKDAIGSYRSLFLECLERFLDNL